MEKYKNQIGVGGLVISKREKELVNGVLDSSFLTYGDYSYLYRGYIFQFFTPTSLAPL